jgi:hypothetical protein
VFFFSFFLFSLLLHLAWGLVFSFALGEDGGIGLDCTVEYIYVVKKREGEGRFHFGYIFSSFFHLVACGPDILFFLFESGELDIQNFRVPYLIAVNVVPIYVCGGYETWDERLWLAASLPLRSGHVRPGWKSYDVTRLTCMAPQGVTVLVSSQDFLQRISAPEEPCSPP